MKKDDQNKTKDLFSAFLPDQVKDDPNENLKKEKKIYSIIFIVVCTLLLVANLITMIINFCISLPGGFSSLFVGFINCAINIFLIGLMIIMAHNISKITRATLFMCNKLMKDEKRYIEENKKKTKGEEEPDSEVKQDNEEEKVESNEEDNKNNQSNLDDEVTTIDAEVVID